MMLVTFLKFWAWNRVYMSQLFGWLAFEAAYSCLDEWDELLVRMLEACKEESDDRKVILQFIQCCLTFIDKCIYYGIFDSLKLGATQHRTV